MSSSPAKSPGRILVVDLLRLLATFQMVQGHTIDAVLAPAHREGLVHGAWLYARGLTSVAFLFAAGLSFHIATVRCFERHRADPSAVQRRFRRAGTLLLIGYLLHFPLGWALASEPSARLAALHDFAIVDILQCIGVTLALVELLVVWLPSARAVELSCGALGVLALAVAPLAAGLEPGGWTRPLVAYLTPGGGSIFPLLPWAAHMLLGVALAPLLLRGRMGARMLVVGGALLLLAAGGAALGAQLWAEHASRLGWVVVGCAGLNALAGAARRWPDWVLLLAGETLFIYVVHIVLAYGQGLGLADRVGPTLGPAASSLLALGMLVLSCGLALGYRRAAAGLAAGTATG
jgi:uncharacterized membrane protein